MYGPSHPLYSICSICVDSCFRHHVMYLDTNARLTLFGNDRLPFPRLVWMMIKNKIKLPTGRQLLKYNIAGAVCLPVALPIKLLTNVC